MLYPASSITFLNKIHNYNTYFDYENARYQKRKEREWMEKGRAKEETMAEEYKKELLKGSEK